MRAWRLAMILNPTRFKWNPWGNHAARQMKHLLRYSKKGLSGRPVYRKEESDCKGVSRAIRMSSDEWHRRFCLVPVDSRSKPPKASAGGFRLRLHYCRGLLQPLGGWPSWQSLLFQAPFVELHI